MRRVYCCLLFSYTKIEPTTTATRTTYILSALVYKLSFINLCLLFTKSTLVIMNDPSIDYGVKKDSELHSSESTQESRTDPKSQTPPGTSLQQGEEKEPSPNYSPRTIHGWKWAAAVISLYIGALIYGLDGTIAADIQSAVIEQFDEVEKLTWIGTAFPLGSLCAILPG